MLIYCLNGRYDGIIKLTMIIINNGDSGIGQNNDITSPWGIMVTVKLIFGSRPLSSSMIVTLTLAVDWPGENLIDWVTAI